MLVLALQRSHKLTKIDLDSIEGVISKMVAQGRMPFHQVAEIGMLIEAVKSHAYELSASHNTLRW